MDDKTLDNIFKAAFNNKSKISQEEGDWDAFEIMLKNRSMRKNFFSFQWNRFNIYYTGILLACLISGSLVYYQNYVWNTPDEGTKASTPVSVDSSSVQSGIVEIKDTSTSPVSSKVESTDINKANKQSNSIVKNTSSIPSTLTKDSTTNLAAPVIVKDTVASVSPTPAPVTTTQPVVMKRKKTIVVTTPQDTVIKIDTVKVKKGRKK